VLSALRVTTGSGSFKTNYRLSTTPGTATPTTPAPCGTVDKGAGVVIDCGVTGGYQSQGVTLSGEGVINVSPTAMVTSSNVPGLGLVTTRINGTDVWEEGGGNYGMAAGSGTSISPGGPLSQFAPLVLGTLGQREGAIAMSSMASPTGYLDIAQQSITAASRLGDDVVDGVPVHVYEVSIGLGNDRTGLTAEEVKTADAADALLTQQGYRATTVRLSIDLLGFIRRAQTTVMFADGGTVDADTTFSDFGCSAIVVTPKGPSIVDDPGGCAPTATATTTTTVAP